MRASAPPPEIVEIAEDEDEPVDELPRAVGFIETSEDVEIVDLEEVPETPEILRLAEEAEVPDDFYRVEMAYAEEAAEAEDEVEVSRGEEAAPAADETSDATAETPRDVAAEAPRAVATEAPPARGSLEPPAARSELPATLRQAVDAGRVDLYLQPIVTLPDRKLCYYEGLTRVRTATEEVLKPDAYVAAAESAGIMPLIDNVLIVKSVQVLRRLSPESKVKGIFCNVSTSSLLDPDFFPELVEFMEENSSLSESLVFEIGQPAFRAMSHSDLAALDTLGALGYAFSLDHVTDLDIDFDGLRERFFRFVKIEANVFLNEMEQRGAVLPTSEMKAYIDDFDLKLIVEKVEDERTVAQLLDYGVDYAQGYLFGLPRLMSPALIREIENAA
jgi:cyclic-di-GMP phosphodiesterase TipF (flagellum assembly factor)